MINAIIYEISIISCYCHVNLLLTAITCTTISTVIKFFKLHYKIKTCNNFYRNIYLRLVLKYTILSLSEASSPPLASFIIAYSQKDYMK